MALTFPAPTLTGGMNLKDYSTDDVSVQLYLTSPDAVAAQVALQSLATAYADGVGGCSIEKLRVTQRTENITDDGSAPTNPVPVFGHEGQKLARFVFNKNGGGTYSLDVPGPVEAILDANDKKRINTGHPKVAAFITVCLAELTAPDGAALVSLKEAYVHHNDSKIG